MSRELDNPLETMTQTFQSARAKNRIKLLSATFLILTLWFALSLRFVYIRHVSPFVDEYISILAMQSVVEHGAPVLPSGLFYGPKGLLHTYLGGFAFLLLGQSEFVARLPSVAAGIMTVCFVYRVGRDWFSPVVGLTSATALAWLPAAVMWSGRARMYGLLQLLALAAGYFLFEGYLRSVNRWKRITGFFLMVLAVYTHTLALVILGGIGIGIIISWLELRPESRPALAPSWGEMVVGALVVLFIILLDPVSGPWGARIRLSDVSQGALTIQTIQERIPYLLAFTHQFITWPLWPLTLFYTVGFIALTFRLVTGASVSGDNVALGLYSLILCVWLGTAVLSRLHDDRYLFGIIPFFLLLAFRALYLLIVAAWVSTKFLFLRSHSLAISGMVSILVIALFAPSTIRLFGEDPYGFVPAYVYVRDNWQSGDVVATCSPAPSYLVLERTDYYLIQHGAESSNGVDIWTGASLTDTPEKFTQILQDHSRVWFVIEKLCWQRHFDADFQSVVEREMDVVFDQKGMLVFVSEE